MAKTETEVSALKQAGTEAERLHNESRLRAAMRNYGRAVHEEAVLADLLEELSRPRFH